MQLARIGIRVWKIEPAKQPFFRSVAKPGVNMEIALAHIYLESALLSLVGDPILIGDWRSDWSHFTDKIDNLAPNARMRKVRRMNA